MDASVSRWSRPAFQLWPFGKTISGWNRVCSGGSKVVSTEASNSKSEDLRPLTLKTSLLLVLASVKRMGDLQALSVSPSRLEFEPNDSKIVLKPRHGYIPKVLSTPFRVQVITLLALPPSEQDQRLNLLCPVRALRIYIERSAPLRQSEQLFVSFGGCTKGHKAETIQMDN